MSDKLGIVLTDRRIVAGRNGSIILNTRSCVTRLRQTGGLFCPGAVACISAASIGVVSYPIKLGVVCDFDGASFMLNKYLKDACRWYHRINLKVNFAMRGCLTESEIRALSNCYPSRANQTFYMQEIIASILGMDEGIVIYVADDFFEIALLRDCRIKHLFVKERALEELRNGIMEFIDEHKLKIGEQTLQMIISDFFCGKDILVHASHKITAEPQELKLNSTDYLLISSSWLNNVKDYIVTFIEKHNVEDKLYLMSDFDNVDFLTHELSSRCNVKIRSMNNALEKIAINLSLR